MCTGPVTRRRLLEFGSLIGLASPALALPRDVRPLRLLVPFTPGGSADILARGLGLALGPELGQVVVVENVPGAGGTLAMDRMARAPHDGQHLLLAHIGTLAITPTLYGRQADATARSLTPVAWVAQVPNLLVVHPSLPAQDLAQFVAGARQRPGQWSYGSGGNGSAAHTTMALLAQRTGISLQHVPYKGTAPAVQDLVAGHIQATFTGLPALLPQVRSGKLRGLAVSSPTRLPSLPQIPTVAESGLEGTAGFEADQWYGVVGPPGLPMETVRRLNQAIGVALQSPALAHSLAAEGAQPQTATPEVFAAWIQSERSRWAQVVRSSGMKVD